MTAPVAGPGRGAARQATDDAGTASSAVAILTPTGRDGAVADRVLGAAGFERRLCADMAALCAAVDDHVGVLLVAEEALAGAARAALLAALAAQPPWSDVPLVILTGEGELSRGLSPALGQVTARANATLLERPVRVATLVTALRSALRARRRQFDVRDHLAERVAAEASLRAAHEAADAANRSKGEFLAVMSHELRTPLNAIGGYAELLDLGIHGPITPDQRGALERIQKSQRHLLGLINGVLNYARVEAGAVLYDLREVDLDDVLGTCEALTAPQMRAKALAFDRGACAGGLRVRADREKLEQVLLNLLSNAIKFTEPAGQVAVSCEAAGDRVLLRVRDTGIGIAPDELARVFEAFVQVDARFTRTQEGTGLGLAISRDLARGMGGDLTAESRPGVGSTFTLALPRA
jgi:signal transduction histidine kinase